MNTNRINRIRIATLTTVVAFVACASTATPAFAGETHSDGDGGAGTNTESPYAMPLDALDGMTRAQYVREHQDGYPRTAMLI